MKYLLQAIACACALLVSCSTPFVARVSFEGEGTMAFDGDLFAVVAEGDGAADLSMKGATGPLYPYVFAWSGGIVYVASVSEEWAETYELGEPLSLQAQATLASLFTVAQLELLEELPGAASAEVPGPGAEP